jgi:hypothetical protein
VFVIATIVSVLAMAVWLGLMVWAAMRDGRTQREHEQDSGYDDQESE